MTDSKTSPNNSDATDYTWQTKKSHVIKGGRLPDDRDVCYIEELAELLTTDEAISLATDLLRWAQFIAEGNEAETPVQQKFARQAD